MSFLSRIPPSADMKPQTAFPYAAALASATAPGVALPPASMQSSIPSATKMPALRKMRFWSLLLLGMLAIGLARVDEARAAITYQSAGALAYSTAGAPTSVAPAYPASIATGDLLVLIIGMKPGTANSGSVTTPTGWTAITSLTGAGGYGTTLGADTGNTNVFAYYTIAAGGETGSLTVTLATNNISWAQMYRLSNATGGWSVAGTTGSDTTGDGTVSIAMSANPGVTAGDYILGAMVIPTDVTTPSQFSSEALSQAGITFGTVTEIAEPDSGTGNDIGGFTFGAPVSSGTATGVPTLTAAAATTNTNVRGPGVFIRCRETASTTLGNGTDPANASLAPSGAATMADAFTFQTSSGTDTITAVVVGLATGTSGGLSLVEITNDGGTTVYGSTTDPASDTPTVTLSTNTLTATTTSTQYKIRITPKSHAAMPVPPGSTYSVTAKINSWTGTNTAAGSDTAGTTVTIDNLSSSDITGSPTGTAGDGNVALSGWTVPGDASRVIVVRDTTTVATPAEGDTTYNTTTNNLIGSSTVVCDGAAITTCTDNSVTNGTTYLYRIYTRDSIGNYSAGVTPAGSPYTPAGPGCYSVATGNWSATSTWANSVGGTPGTCPGAGNLPDAATPAYINFTTTSHTVTVDVGNAAAVLVRIGTPGTGTAGLAVAAGTLTVGGSVTLVGGTGTKKALLSFTTGTLKLGGNLTDSGATVLTWSTGTVEYNGTGAQTVGAYGYYNLTINKTSGTATTGANITIGNNLTLTTGTLNIGANSCDRGTAGGTLTLGSGSLLQIAAANLPANYSTVSIATTSTVEYNPSFNAIVPAPGGGANYGNLLLSNSGNRTFNAAMTVAGNLTTTGTVVAVMNAGITVNGNVDIGSGTSFDPKTYTHTFKGNYTNNGSTVSDGTNTGTIVMDGASAQAISGSGLYFYSLTTNNSAGVTTSASFSIASNFTNTAGFGVTGTPTTTFNGTAAQTLGGSATTFYGLVLNNAAGFTLNYDTTATNALTLSSGAVATGVNTLIFSSTSTCTATRTSGYVNGKLRKSFTASVTDCNFEVGDNTNYTPVNVALTSVSCTGTCTVTASTTGTDHPQINASGIDSTASVNRYWTLVPAGTFTFTNATLTFTYIGGVTVDNDDTAVASTYIAQRYDVASTNWLGTNKTSSSSTSMVCYGPTTFGTTSYSDFAVGKPAATADSGAREREFIFNRELFY